MRADAQFHLPLHHSHPHRIQRDYDLRRSASFTHNSSRHRIDGSVALLLSQTPCQLALYFRFRSDDRRYGTILLALFIRVQIGAKPDFERKSHFSFRRQNDGIHPLVHKTQLSRKLVCKHYAQAQSRNKRRHTCGGRGGLCGNMSYRRPRDFHKSIAFGDFDSRSAHAYS